MTEAELTRLEALAAAATPGPWNNQGVIVLAGEDTCIARLWLTHPAKGSEETNAAFIAASREAVPALIAEVERLRKQLLVSEALQDSAYNAGVGAGWNAAQHSDQKEAEKSFAQLRSDKSYLKVLKEARVALEGK